MTHLVLPFHRMEEAAPYLDPKRLHYLHEGQSESFESFEDFDLLAFDWYDIHSDRTETAKILVYVTQEALFFFCESQPAETCVQGIMGEILEQEGGDLPAEQALSRFFLRLLKGDMDYLDRFEGEVNEAEAHILSGTQATKKDVLHRIIAWRRVVELIHTVAAADVTVLITGESGTGKELAANETQLLTRPVRRRMVILGSRMDRYLGAVRNLQDIISQMREAYQSQLAIQQNQLMKLFTVVTVVFLPLTLLTGWYGMNFVGMPELTWKYGYPVAIVVSVVIVVALLRHFKKKNWL